MSLEPPPDERTAGQLRLEEALTTLQSAIEARVRAEQQVDQLTALANDAALSAWLEEKLASGSYFWIAFVEVDRFKSVNAAFGYQNADELLKRIASQLKTACRDFLPGGAVPFRAHGDEFFVAGQFDDALSGRVAESLDHLRRSVELLEIPLVGKPPMKCTVSVGWLTSLDSREVDGLNERGVRTQLELAVSVAKRERNTVVRYTKDMVQGETKDGRADCGACAAKFSITIQVTQLRSEHLRCPNCGGEVARPQELAPPAEPALDQP